MTIDPTTRARRGATADDTGFTLVEVIISLALIGVIATSALMLVNRGVASGSTIQREQNAVTVANAAMEVVRSVSATAAADGVTALVTGRSATDVSTQWAASLHPDRARTYQASDSTAAALSAGAVIPLTTLPRVAGTEYRVSTLIGTCYRLRTDLAGACTTTGGSGRAAATGYVAMARVMVDVTWAPVSPTSCGGARCSYRLTALVDPTQDRPWRPVLALVAVDDSATVVAGSSVAVRVLDNDTATPATSNPVTIVRGPSTGSATADPTTGVVTYTAPVGTTGAVTFAYTITDTAASTSNQATVTITVTAPPLVAQDCSVLVPANSPYVDLKLVDCMTGEDSTTRITVVSLAITQGQLAVDGREANNNRTGSVVSYQPQTNVTGRHTFTWYATRSDGQRTATVTTTIRIVPVAVNDAYQVRASSRNNRLAVFGNDRPNNYGQTVEILDYTLPTCGTLSASQGDLQNGVVSFDAPAATGTCTATYRLSGRANGTSFRDDVSNSATVTITVAQ